MITAVLEIGSTGIRLLVAEIMGRSWQVIDEAEKPVALGVDVFGTGAVSRESMLECLQVVRNFQELLATYRLEQDAIHVIATSAIRVARNRDIFVDRLRQETGFVPEIVDGIEETRLMYLAVRSALGDSIPEFWKSPSMIVDMGGGSTEIMLLRRGKIVAAHSLRLGSVLVGRQERMAGGNSWFSGSITTSSRDRYLEERVRNTADFLNAEMNLSMVQHIVLAGGDPRPLALLHGDPVNDHCMSISRAEYCKQVDAIRSMSIESSARRFNIPITEAEGFVPGNIVYRLFLESTAADAVIVPFTNIREGILLDRVIGADTELQNEFAYQTIASAVNLGRKYHFDEPHSKHVAALTVTIFDALEKEHGMTARHRMILETAAILHDIGIFIRTSGHQKHGQYLVAHSEIFGLHPEEQAIAANVVGYHRGPPPSEADFDYIALQREERILVLKMASILRVADALDRSHRQRIKTITLERLEETVVIHTDAPLDLTTERIAVEEKAAMFQDVFGYKVILE